MSIIVIGTGPVGGIIGGRLARAGQDVTFVDSDREHIAAIRKIQSDELLRNFHDYLLGLATQWNIFKTGGIRELLTPDNVNRFRNGAAHVSVYPKEWHRDHQSGAIRY